MNFMRNYFNQRRQKTVAKGKGMFSSKRAAGCGKILNACRLASLILLLIPFGKARGDNPTVDSDPFPTINVTYPLDEASGPRFRKIALDGRPMPDEKPQDSAETEEEKEETFVDSLTLNLHHSDTDIYVPIPGSTLFLGIRRDVTSTVWDAGLGSSPAVQHTTPFGAGWTTNIPCADLFKAADGGGYTTITDENGSTHRFVLFSGTYVALPNSQVDASDSVCSLVYANNQFTYTGKYGTTIIFNSVLAGVSNKNGGVDGYFAPATVTDRVGNELDYTYPNNTTLIPSVIALHNHPQLRILITTTPVTCIGDNGATTIECISQVTDPNGNTWNYTYGTAGYEYPGGGIGAAPVLVSVAAPQSIPLSYPDFVPTPQLIPTKQYAWTVGYEAQAAAQGNGTYVHLDLQSITDALKNTYSFSYGFVNYKWASSSLKGYFKQTGLASIVTKVSSPENQTSYFSPGNSLVKVIQETGGNLALSSSCKRESVITDAEGKTTTYTFGDGSVILPVDLDPSSEIVMMIPYQLLTISYGAIGQESYTFDINSSMALSSMTDLSGNTTMFAHTDPIPTTSAAYLFDELYGLGDNTGTCYYDDPNIQTDPFGKTKSFSYGPYRIMQSSTDEDLHPTMDIVDSFGRRQQEIVGLTQETDFGYDPVFRGVVTSRFVGGLGLAGQSIATHYGLDSNGRIASEQIGTLPPTVYINDLNGNKTYESDPDGNPTSFSYDACNRLTGVYYADTSCKLYAYDANGNKVYEKDEDGNITTYVYDHLNRLTEVDKPLGVHTEYGYNKVNSKIWIYNPRNYWTTINYDEMQRVSSVVDALSGSTSFVYGQNSGSGGFDSSGFKPTTITDPRGIVTSATYDALYRATSRQVDYASGALSTTFTGYDGVGNVTSGTDPLGNVTTTTYDALNRPLTVTYADNTTASTSYTPFGAKWRTTDERGIVTEDRYDGEGRLTMVVADLAGLSATTQTVYDSASNVLATINPLGFEWDYQYDNRNRKINELAPAVSGTRPFTQWGYDYVGNMTKVIDPNSNETDTNYDVLNRPYEVIAPAAVGGTTWSLYDSNGNIVTGTDPNGNVTQHTFDPLDRLLSTTDGAGDTVSYQYDGVGNRISVTDGRGNLTSFTYDGLNRNTSITDALSGTTTFVYNALNKTARIDANETASGSPNATHYTYDQRNRLQTISYDSFPSDNRTYGYDLAGDLSSVTENNTGPAALVSCTYDALRRVTGETNNGYTHSYTYDLAGNRLASLYGGDTSPIVYTYDPLNRLNTLTENGRVTTYGYDLNGNLTSKSLPDGGVDTSTYDALNRVSTEGFLFFDLEGDPELPGYAYTHDLDGNLTGISESGWLISNDTEMFAYDGANRLTDEWTAVNLDPLMSHNHYGYDAANNQQELDVWASGAVSEVVTTSSFNAANELVSSLSTSGSSVSYGYDFNGNRITRTIGGLTDQYGYDGENRLTSLTQANGNTNAYTYDYRSRRLERVENGVATDIVFSGGISVKEFQLGMNTVEYIRGHEMGGGIGSILYSNRGGQLSLDHYNSRGDVAARSNAWGLLTYQAHYDAFGTHPNDFFESSRSPDRQQANTKEEDPTGLLLEGFRYRDLETGAFITRDPIGNNLMMPKEKWIVDGKEVKEREYEEALEPGVPQVGAGPVKTAKNTGEEADIHTALAVGQQEIPGQKSHYHTTAAGFPNLYTYVNQNPWTFFDPEGLDVNVPDEKLRPQVLKDLKKTFKGDLSFDQKGNLSRKPTSSDTGYDKRLDSLIASKNVYTIDTKASAFAVSNYSPDSRTIHYDPQADYVYKQMTFESLMPWSKFKVTDGNGASALGHEVMRAYSQEIGEPQNNDAAAKQNVVDRANEGYTRQGLNARTAY